MKNNCNGQYSHNVCSTCVHIIDIDNGQESGHLDGQSVNEGVAGSLQTRVGLIARASKQRAKCTTCSCPHTACVALGNSLSVSLHTLCVT